MYVSAYVPECDITGVKYSSAVRGAYAVARGATGRYCAVLYIGPEAIEEKGLVVKTYEEAVAIVKAEGGFVDF
jgi:hypothetical protein